MTKKKKTQSKLPQSQEMLAHMLMDGEDITILFRVMKRHGLKIFTCGGGEGGERFVVSIARGTATATLAAGSIAIGEDIERAKQIRRDK